MNQSISEEFRKKFAAPKWAPEKMQDIFNELMFGKDGVLDFWESKISQAITAERKELIKTIDSFPLQDQIFFDDANWKAGYRALEELKRHLVSLLEEK